MEGEPAKLFHVHVYALISVGTLGTASVLHVPVHVRPIGEVCTLIIINYSLSTCTCRCEV